MAADYVHAVCLGGDEAALRRLLEAAPAAALAADADGRLPLHWAASHGKDAVVRLLLEAAPAAAMAADAAGRLPLHRAAYAGQAAVVRLLLEAAPAAAMAADADGRLPLHLAAQAGHDAVVRVFVEAAPHVAVVKTADGAIPLQLACRAGHASTACALLGACPAAVVLACLAFDPSALPLFPDFLLAPARLPLAACLWVLVPTPCPGIERALSAALACDPAQAAQVVRRLQPAAAARLRTAAVCLRRHGLPGAVAALIVARCA